jgi:hypothetical protein
MGIFMIMAAIFIIGLILALIFKESWRYDTLETMGQVAMFVSGISILVCGLVCLAMLGTAETDYQNMVDKRDAIEYRLEQIENGENLLVNGGVYDDIIEYNAEVRKYKAYGSSNFWTNWFNPAPIDKLDYIEFKPGKE